MLPQTASDDQSEQQFGLLAGNAVFLKVNFLLSEPNSHCLSWFLQALASTARDTCTSLRKSKVQCGLLHKPIAAKISGRLSPVAWPTVNFPTR